VTNCGCGSCFTSLEVPGGTFSRSYGASYPADDDPATVSGFRLDEYLVTVGRFRQLVAAWNNGSGYLPAAGSGIQTQLDGGAGVANAAQPGTYETGWDATDWNADVVPTNANLGACSPYSTWTNVAGTQENLPINCVNWYEAYAFCI
jgi:formylglycine-generating enzyme